MAVLVMSLCLKSLLNLTTKFEYVPRVTVPVVLMEFSQKVAAQMMANPLIM